MKWRYLGHLQPLSKAKHSLLAMAKKEVCPRDEIVDPPGTVVLPIDIHGFAEDLVSFRTLCGVQSSLVRFASRLYLIVKGVMNELHRCDGQNGLWCAEDGGRVVCS